MKAGPDGSRPGSRDGPYFLVIIIFSIIMDMCIIMFFIIFMSIVPIIWCIFISLSFIISMLHIAHFIWEPLASITDARAFKPDCRTTGAH